MEELDANMEDNEGAEEEKEEVNLGKLQFSLDYDFQKNEVSVISFYVMKNVAPSQQQRSATKVLNQCILFSMIFFK